MALLYPSPIRSDFFTYVAAENLLVCEASDFYNSFRTGQVYDDACDDGFTVVSVATGKRAVFALPTEVWDEREGELLYVDWSLAPESARALRLDGRSDKIRVRIYND